MRACVIRSSSPSNDWFPISATRPWRLVGGWTATGAHEPPGCHDGGSRPLLTAQLAAAVDAPLRGHAAEASALAGSSLADSTNPRDRGPAFSVCDVSSLIPHSA